MRFFLSRRIPKPTRILLVESGSRELLENLIPAFRNAYGPSVPIDLVTCYEGLPRGLDPASTTLYAVSDYQGRDARKRLYRELRSRGYNMMGIICSAEPIMAKWKWAIVAQVRAKLFVLNENGDYFWADYGNWRIIRHFVLFRAGLAGAGAVRTLGRLILFPLTLLYLLLYASTVHFRRFLRRGYR